MWIHFCHHLLEYTAVAWDILLFKSVSQRILHIHQGKPAIQVPGKILFYFSQKYTVRNVL